MFDNKLIKRFSVCFMLVVMSVTLLPVSVLAHPVLEGPDEIHLMLDGEDDISLDLVSANSTAASTTISVPIYQWSTYSYL